MKRQVKYSKQSESLNPLNLITHSITMMAGYCGLSLVTAQRPLHREQLKHKMYQPQKIENELATELY